MTSMDKLEQMITKVVEKVVRLEIVPLLNEIRLNQQNRQQDQHLPRYQNKSQNIGYTNPPVMNMYNESQQQSQQEQKVVGNGNIPIQNVLVEGSTASVLNIDENTITNPNQMKLLNRIKQGFKITP